MENFILEPTKSTPSVYFNKHGVLIISGKSLPEDSLSFYKPILDNVREFVEKNPNDSIQITIEMEYVNTSSSKMLLTLLEIPIKAGFQTSIVWAYEEGDDDIEELGTFIEESLNVDFTYKVMHDH
jgi:hypothetical protein